MPRRVSLPGADELFGGARAESPDQQAVASQPAKQKKPTSGPSGRVRHDEKITVYVSTDELLSLEQIRLRLRVDHGINVDRGRLVRVAIGMLADELPAGGENETVLERLRK